MELGVSCFGRIGRTFVRINLQYISCDPIAVRDTCSSIKIMAYFIKHHATHPQLDQDVRCVEAHLAINSHRANCTSYSNIEDRHWSGADTLFDRPRRVRNLRARRKVAAKLNSRATVKRFIGCVDNEIIVGVNECSLKVSDRVTLDKIYDANSITHTLKWNNDAFGIADETVTTLNSWLSYKIWWAEPLQLAVQACGRYENCGNYDKH